MRGTFSEASHRAGARGRAWLRREPLLARCGPGYPRGRRLSGLPADAPAELHGLALLLAPVEDSLEPGRERHEQREEDHQAEAEERDDLVVRLAVEALAVVAGEGGGRRDQPDREEDEGSEPPHGGRTIPCRTAWPSPSFASSRSRRAAGTSTSTTTSTTRSGSTVSCSPRSSIRPITVSSRTRSHWTATRWT